MKVLVLGATGGSGRAAVEALLAQGHEVSALVRRADADLPQGARIIQGDALRAEDVGAAVAGQDAVIVTLGIRENTLRVRLLGPAHTPLDVRSRGTRHVIAAMRAHGVKRLVVQTSYGVGATRDRLSVLDKLFFALLIAPQIADTEQQERAVRESGLDWLLIQPVHLTDGPEADLPLASATGEVGALKVSRKSVGRFLASAATDGRYVHQSLALSSAATHSAVVPA